MALSYSETTLDASSIQRFLSETFSREGLLALAKEVGFVCRAKKFIPAILVSACLEACDDSEWTLNSIYRKYATKCIECGLEVMSWEPFFDFLQKP